MVEETLGPFCQEMVDFIQSITAQQTVNSPPRSPEVVDSPPCLPDDVDSPPHSPEGVTIPVPTPPQDQEHSGAGIGRTTTPEPNVVTVARRSGRQITKTPKALQSAKKVSRSTEEQEPGRTQPRRQAKSVRSEPVDSGKRGRQSRRK
jgi:hypothetical protein